jgi:hypothetical protein
VQWLGSDPDRRALSIAMDFGPSRRSRLLVANLFAVLDALVVRSVHPFEAHEIVYREAIQYGATTSFATRYFNDIVSSDAISHYSPAQYVVLTLLVNLPCVAIPSDITCSQRGGTQVVGFSADFKVAYWSGGAEGQEVHPPPKGPLPFMFNSCTCTAQ